MAAIQTVFAYYILSTSIPVKDCFGNWVRLDCRIAVSNRSYDPLKTILSPNLLHNWLLGLK